MDPKENFPIILVLGSLWGFFEMISLPVFILCSLGLLFLLLGRRLVDVPRTSILMGLIVCFYKTYGNNFFVCRWVGVMALAGSFDLYRSLVFKSNWVSDGTGRIINYSLNSVLLVALISGLISTHIGSFSGPKVKKYNTLLPRKLFPEIYITATILLWIVASVN